MPDKPSVLERLAVIETRLDAGTEMHKKFVSQEKFWPVAMIAYGIAAAVLTGVIGALLSLVVKKGTVG